MDSRVIYFGIFVVAYFFAYPLIRERVDGKWGEGTTPIFAWVACGIAFAVMGLHFLGAIFACLAVYAGGHRRRIGQLKEQLDHRERLLSWLTAGTSKQQDLEEDEKPSNHV